MRVIKGAGLEHVAVSQHIVLDGYWAAFASHLGKIAPYVPSLPVIVTFLWIIFVMNAYNFMDGIDGLAGMFLIAVGLGLLAVYLPEARQLLALRAHICAIMVFAALLVGVSLGFLFYNRPRASIFLGDCGSQYVGFILATALVQITRVAGEPPADAGNVELDLVPHAYAYVDFLGIVILVFPFLYDVTYTLLRRLVRGKAVWRAHHEHLYQRLIDRGWSHLAVVLFSFPFYLANAAIFVGYSWAPLIPIENFWPTADFLNRRYFWAALALAPMILYTLIVILVELWKQPKLAAVESAPAEPEPAAAQPHEVPAAQE